MPFSIGDQVKYLNEEGGGEVIRIVDEDHVEIRDEFGFDYIMAKSELVAEGKNVVDYKGIHDKLKGRTSPLHAEELHEHHPIEHISIKMKDHLMESQKHWTRKDRDFIEVDLHIEELVERPAFLNDGQKLHYQLDYARSCLEEAIRIRMKRIVFIHGVGSGVLRHELRNWLKTLSYLHLENANYKRYGIGATEVCIHNDVFNV